MGFSYHIYIKILRIKFRWIKNWIKYLFIRKKINATNSKDISSYQKSRNSGPESVICHAPLRSIYFGFGGVVVPCCFNREFSYGTYPQQTIEEIFSSNRRHELSNNLSTQNFTYGCKHCLEMINSKNFDGVEARLYDGLKNHKGVFPSEMIFELDNTCNLECIMCEGRYSSSILKNRDGLNYIPGPYDSSFIEQITPYLKNLEVAKFIGGEPFLIKMYYNIWEKIIELNPNCIINLQTNGTIFNKKIEDLMKRGRFQIGISIDSLQKELFEKIRKNANFEIVMENLDKFIALSRKKGCFVNVSVCPMIQNWEGIPALVNFCNQKNIFIYFNTVYTENFDLRELPSTELEKIYHLYKNTQIKGRKYIAKRNRDLLQSLSRQIEDWYLQKLTDEKRNIKRHIYEKPEFISLFEQLLIHADSSLKTTLYRNLSEISDEIILSDAQVDFIHQIKKEELIEMLNKETDSSIREMLNKFLIFNNFSTK